MSDLTPTLLPLGDTALLVRFATHLEDQANRAAISLAQHLGENQPAGVLEIAPNLVSVLIRYNPAQTGFAQLAGEIRLQLSTSAPQITTNIKQHKIAVRFGGETGPDLEEVAEKLNLSVLEFISAHNAKPLRVLATGFAPGFVYCGMHDEAMHLPRRRDVRAKVPAGTVLFAAGQTAITATPIPTGWHVIGHTDFSNFDPDQNPPTTLRAGDKIIFKAASQ